MIGKSQVTNKRRTLIFIGIIWLISFLIMFRQLVSTGYWSCQVPDTYAFTSWAIQVTDSLRHGIVYPRWTSLSFWGYGSPTFILDSPLAYYLTAFFSMFTGSVIIAMNFAKFTALFFAGTGMYFLVNEFYSDKTALLSASFYLLLPYNIFGIYVF